MILVDPLTGTEIETFTDEATQHFIANGYWQKVTPNPDEKPKPKRTRRTAKKAVKDG